MTASAGAEVEASPKVEYIVLSPQSTKHQLATHERRSVPDRKGLTSSDTGEGHGFTASAGMFVAAAKRLNRPIFGSPGEALRSWTGSCNCLVASEMSYRVLLNQS